MTTLPLILITNDDGIDSPGLHAAAAACASLGELLIVAPATPQSGMGRAKPPGNSGRVEERPISLPSGQVMGYAVGGSPAQCVVHALVELAPRPVSLVVSGINYGENLGEGIVISGTVGAALEAASFGLPALAVSRQTDPHYFHNPVPGMDFTVAASWVQRLARMVLEQGLPAGAELLKIDIPQDASLATPMRWTRLSRQRYFYPIPRRWDPQIHAGPLGFEIRVDGDTLEADSDIQAVVMDKVVSITPITTDLTAPWAKGASPNWPQNRPLSEDQL